MLVLELQQPKSLSPCASEGFEAVSSILMCISFSCLQLAIAEATQAAFSLCFNSIKAVSNKAMCTSFSCLQLACAGVSSDTSSLFSCKIIGWCECTPVSHACRWLALQQQTMSPPRSSENIKAIFQRHNLHTFLMPIVGWRCSMFSFFDR